MSAGPAESIRPARPADAGALVALVRDSFAPDVRAAMIYGARGAGRWVRSHLALPAATAERTYTVATRDGAVVGAADLQRAGDTIFLSYIAVAPAARGSGLATRLLGAALDRTSAARDIRRRVRSSPRGCGPGTWTSRPRRSWTATNPRRSSAD